MPDDQAPIRFEDLSLAAAFIYSGFQLDIAPPTEHGGLATFQVERNDQTQQLIQDYVTSSFLVDPRRFYDALGIAKRLVHRAREAGQ